MKTLAIVLLSAGIACIPCGLWWVSLSLTCCAFQCWTWNDDGDDETEMAD